MTDATVTTPDSGSRLKDPLVRLEGLPVGDTSTLDE